VTVAGEAIYIVDEATGGILVGHSTAAQRSFRFVCDMGLANSMFEITKAEITSELTPYVCDGSCGEI